MNQDELWRHNMDSSITELLRQGRLGTNLTDVDWNILLQDASDSGSLDGVLVASNKLKRKPPLSTLENLLLTAICSGEGKTAVAACTEIKRNLTEKETFVLLESIILSGNVQEFFDCFSVDNKEVLGMFHTTMAIAVCRSLRRNRKENMPMIVNLHSWVNVYHNEFSIFKPLARIKVSDEELLSGTFFIFTKETCNLLLGALLVEDAINKECAKAIMQLHF